ncbi:MAG: histidine triad nucleotide-binding protein [Candidatus Marinimicrobia bacterium]|nr:histidine triad nucleotide-binding protein [Candidatus Neomarinimicrobiota bacterium]
MKECLFCRIVDKEIPAEIVFESDKLLAFKDVDPQAPVHILIIPKEHITTTNDLSNKHKELLGDILLTAKQLASEYDIAEDGYRIVFNCNKNGGQAVYHIHLHLLGGRQMKWPPG